MFSLRLFPVSRLLIATCALGGLLMASTVRAGGLEVSPTTLQITSQQSADGITLSNVGATALHAQVRVFAWSQQDNEDLLTPSNALIVSPPMLQIAPGSSQLLRVIRSSGAPAPGTEQTYRLIIDEIPATVTPTDAAGSAPPKGLSNSLNFYMRYSLPVFLGDTNDAPKTQLTWRVDKAPREWTLTVTNNGPTAHRWPISRP
ncbi:fimbrial biogenesis chaperone [Diaphorobacter aerolatus]|uniref:Molecular chaperone n=1 Tax=Diaphorobacter aerolatus TaxID=1288495 RepID=A0A7H0GP44_9BURK|nr:fimbria/pilus periplasmic chaperone [Diaphorobacter aerolatus]QNP50060.1 molecular chaperone [Diaphorobacter aerolatus]